MKCLVADVKSNREQAGGGVRRPTRSMLLILRAPLKMRSVAAWQKEHEYAAGAFFRLTGPDPQNTPMTIDDLPADPQPQAVALIALGGEEGLKDLG